MIKIYGLLPINWLIISTVAFLWVHLIFGFFTQILWPGRQRKARGAALGIQNLQEIHSPASNCPTCFWISWSAEGEMTLSEDVVRDHTSSQLTLFPKWHSFRFTSIFPPLTLETSQGFVDIWSKLVAIIVVLLSLPHRGGGGMSRKSSRMANAQTCLDVSKSKQNECQPLVSTAFVSSPLESCVVSAASSSYFCIGGILYSFRLSLFWPHPHPISQGCPFKWAILIWWSWNPIITVSAC